MRKLWHKIAFILCLILMVGLAIFAFTLWQQGRITSNLLGVYI